MTRHWLALAAPPAVFFLFAAACSSSSTPPADAGADATTNDVTAPREDADEIPCAPREVLTSVCQQCHARSPQRGAPFSLARRSDFLVVRDGMTIREAAIQEIQAFRMPLAPVTIQEGQRTVLLDWLRAGAPAVSPTTCADIDAGVDADADADAGADADADADLDAPAD